MLDYNLNSKRIERAKKLQIFMEAIEKQNENEYDLMMEKYLSIEEQRDKIIKQNIQK